MNPEKGNIIYITVLLSTCVITVYFLSLLMILRANILRFKNLYFKYFNTWFLKLICAFVFAYAGCWFCHDAAHIYIYSACTSGRFGRFYV